MTKKIKLDMIKDVVHDIAKDLRLPEPFVTIQRGSQNIEDKFVEPKLAIHVSINDDGCPYVGQCQTYGDKKNAYGGYSAFDLHLAPELGDARMLIVLAHELKHTAMKFRGEKDNEYEPEKFERTGAWYALHLGYMSLRTWKKYIHTHGEYNG